VIEIVDQGRYDDTYCFTEPLRNMGVFNGILAGNCVEILLPTKPITHIDDNQGEIATCILSCVNAGKIEDDQDLEECCDIIVRFLDELIDYQEYPVKAAENSTKRRRNLGIGISDYFHYLARNKVRYNTQEARDLTHNFMEKFQYSLIKASNELAKEKGACEYNNQTKYSKGILPIDLYNTSVDELTKPEYVCDWDSLRESLKEYGIRHSVLSAIPPTSSSSLVSNSTPGIDAPRSLLTVKVSKKGTVKQLVPEYNKCSTYYTTAWELDNIEYLKLIAIMQKFIDQSISANEFYDIKKFPDNKVPISEMIKVLKFCNKYGVKTLYYSNTNDGSDEEESGCVGGACAV
jgi:ribonucleoside-diphosphate reductase alpha chain